MTIIATKQTDEPFTSNKNYKSLGFSRGLAEYQLGFWYFKIPRGWSLPNFTHYVYSNTPTYKGICQHRFTSCLTLLMNFSGSYKFKSVNPDNAVKLEQILCLWHFSYNNRSIEFSKEINGGFYGTPRKISVRMNFLQESLAVSPRLILFKATIIALHKFFQLNGYKRLLKINWLKKRRFTLIRSSQNEAIYLILLWQYHMKIFTKIKVDNHNNQLIIFRKKWNS